MVVAQTTCIGYRKVATFPKHWLETLLVCTIMQFGGTTITGWLLGQSLSWMTSHTAMPAERVSHLYEVCGRNATELTGGRTD